MAMTEEERRKYLARQAGVNKGNTGQQQNQVDPSNSYSLLQSDPNEVLGIPQGQTQGPMNQNSPYQQYNPGQNFGPPKPINPNDPRITLDRENPLSQNMSMNDAMNLRQGLRSPSRAGATVTNRRPGTNVPGSQNYGSDPGQTQNAFDIVEDRRQANRQRLTNQLGRSNEEIDAAYAASDDPAAAAAYKEKWGYTPQHGILLRMKNQRKIEGRLALLKRDSMANEYGINPSEIRSPSGIRATNRQAARNQRGAGGFGGGGGGGGVAWAGGRRSRTPGFGLGGMVGPRGLGMNPAQAAYYNEYTKLAQDQYMANASARAQQDLSDQGLLDIRPGQSYQPGQRNVRPQAPGNNQFMSGNFTGLNPNYRPGRNNLNQNMQ